ncbi:MAG: helix-turn-helix transcriptional regulator, partial [Clostridium sp.]
TYLAKKFKQETGKTVSEYVNEIRIKEAQFIIMATEFKIEDIAYYVGYNDKKYFSKIFKKISGVSPSEYRKFNKEER